MKEIRRIDDNICQYVFYENEDKQALDVNITVLLNGENAMLIDTAYSEQALVVKENLASQGISVDEIMLSHYHPDHAAGATEFPNANLSCSILYEDNRHNCNDIWHKEHDYRKPQQTIINNDSKKYGNFSMTFYETPGHCKCSMVTLIDDKIVHVGDLLMFDVEDKPTVPYISGDGSVKEHLKSLEFIKTLGAEVLILSHGKHLIGEEAIIQAIDKRIHYLKALLDSNGEVDLEECLIGGSNKWAFTRWHKNNLIVLRGDV